MRISDWSSDVCSSDLHELQVSQHHHQHGHARQRLPVLAVGAIVETRLQRLQQRDHRRCAYCRPAGATPEPECAQISSSRSRPRSRASTHLGSNSLPLCAEMKSSASSKLHARSEEHTSELQSLMRISYAVLCLKKKNQLKITH